MPKPGVTDPEAESALELLRKLGYEVSGVRTIRSYRVGGPREHVPRLIQRVLANDAVEAGDRRCTCPSTISVRAGSTSFSSSRFRFARWMTPRSCT